MRKRIANASNYCKFTSLHITNNVTWRLILDYGNSIKKRKSFDCTSLLFCTMAAARDISKLSRSMPHTVTNIILSLLIVFLRRNCFLYKEAHNQYIG